ncbi:MSMEG_0567/sll0787 family protein [Aeromicrobium sp. Root472D3]|uniref:MSMEG_0567/sll0787 family protein n=1 Tax=Aeromicrobium sp. Root472D3 TaxID=1736540 RepID=UPI0006FB82E0|nr:MSMEG_0567/sll0787 family protein [Aeromicrobium sp. Root472D3]KQX76210.1 AIR synthase [Aeromicrobium sp. Root472D3]
MTIVDLDRGILTGTRPSPAPTFLVSQAVGRADLDAYRALRRDVFVAEQGIFDRDDSDRVDDDPRCVVLVARATDGTLLGGVRLAPAVEGRDIGWWSGSRLAVSTTARTHAGIGAALVRAACARAEREGALRFDATVQAQNEGLFRRLGWTTLATLDVHGRPHAQMLWPIDRAQRLADATKAVLGSLLLDLGGAHGALGGAGFVGDDAAPVPGSDLLAACDAILPSMVERDPEWAGWCGVLVNLNDVSAMGASPVGLLDAVGARDASFARRILRGLRAASQAWGVPVIGGHTQLGVPASLSVTALGRTDRPVAGGGAAPGESLRLTADLGGQWRPGYTGSQWDSSSHRRSDELRALAGVVPSLHPTAAKDVSMTGVIGTTGMLAEASGCRAVLDVAHVPMPPLHAATAGDWLTCFPGFAMVSAERTAARATLPGFVDTSVCGRLTEGRGVGLRWPDGLVTSAITGPVTGLGPTGKDWS